MCVGKDCGTFRVYKTSEITVVDLWFGRDVEPPNDKTKIYGLDGLGNDRQRNEAKEKFEQGIRRRWDNQQVHGGDDCPEKCRCVMTNEQVGEESVAETRPWRQPMVLTNGNAPVVIRGTYKRTFRDYKGKCDSNDEVGEPISWDEPEEIAVRRRGQKPRRRT